jgi:high-affinity iron transporter
MEATALIVFRETVEIALILTIVLAATRGLSGRMAYIWGGLAAGVAGSALIAVFAETITNLADGFGQEVMNAVILLLAAAMIGWTAVWMRVHGRELAQKFKEVGHEIRAGNASFFTLSAIIALAMFREGSEIVLFSYGMLATGMAWSEFLLGAALGFAGGMVVGILFYFGMIKVFARYFFSITTWMLVLLSAGLAAKGVKYLVDAGLLPAWGYNIWDTSALLSEESMLGEFLSVLIGYTAQPSGIQIATYIAVVALAVAGIKYSSRAAEKTKNAPTAPMPLTRAGA